jgi:hypothetical protein
MVTELRGSRRTGTETAPRGVPEFFLKPDAAPAPIYDSLLEIIIEQGPRSEQSESVALVDPRDISVLAQPRKIFENIDELADSIATIGLRHAPEVGLHDRSHAVKYLAEVNENWGSKHTLKDLKQIQVNGKPMYLILIAGERRKRAVELLLTEGCSVHQKENGLGGCYHLHRKDLVNKIKVAMYVNPDYYSKAILIQEHENIHMSIRPQDLAISIGNTFKAMKRKDTTWTIEKHAKYVGRGIGLVSSALKYCDAPKEIQDMVDSKELLYGVAVEISKLRNIGVDDLGLFALAIKAKEDRMSVPAVRKLVKGRIDASKGQQINLGELMITNQTLAERKAALRKVMVRSTYAALVGARQQIRGASRLVQTGEISPMNSPLGSQGNMRILIDALQEAGVAVSGIASAIDRGDKEKVERDLPQVISQGMQILPSLEDEEVSLF